MGQQVLAIAGQVVGGYFFGPVGAAIGGAIGGYIGGVLFAEDQVFEGPRLSDLKIQTSNYGNAIPICYGSIRIGGNVDWSTDIRETRIESDVGGKGGPDTTQVDYRYDLDCMIGLGTPPLGEEFVAIERVYANGVLIYDTRAGASPANVFASGQWITGMLLYPGNETQLPDPTMEAALGVGNVSAYRGYGYVLMTGVKLNVLKTSVMPNFEFVVSTSGTADLGRQLLEIDDLTPVYHGPLALSNAQPIITQLSTTIRVANTDDLLVRVYDLTGAHVATEPRTEEELEFPPFSTDGSAPWAAWVTFDAQDALINSINVAVAPGIFLIGSVDMLSVVTTTDILVASIACVDKRHYMILTAPSGGEKINRWWLLEYTGDDVILEDQGPIDTTGLGVLETNVWNISPVFQPEGLHRVGVLESDLIHAWQVNSQDLYVWEIALAAGSPTERVLSRIISFDTPSLPRRDMAAAGTPPRPAIYADNGLAAIVMGSADATTSYLFLYSRLPNVDPDGIPLVDILTDLCERSDLSSSELTFTGISDIVFGFVIGQSMTARAAMEMLLRAYHIDAIDSDTFKFVKRGGASVVDIDYIDLGAGTDAPTIHAVSVNRRQETEMASRVNVKYMSLSADYQIAAQSARRETTGSRETAEVALPIVFDDDNEPAEIADILLREIWAGAFTRSFATTIEYAKYEPTDVLRLDDGLAIRTVRGRARVDKGSLIEWESIDEDVEAYDSNAIGVQIVVPSQDLASVMQGQTSFAVLDIPPLSELQSGNESAAYVAAKGVLSNWPGAAIDVSRDGGSTYTPGTGVTQASVLGAATTALDDFLGGNVWDEASTVRVDVGAGTLSSATHDEVLDGANLSVIGDEVLQFRTATLVSSGVYDLTGFLRGRKGTEWAISTHVAGDAFVLINVLRLEDLPLQISDRVLANLLVRATTGNMLPSQGLVRGFAPRISRLMPYSPAHLSAVRNADGSWYLSWERRDRYMNDWPEGVDVPMSEVSELYDVEVYNAAGDLVETYTDINDKFLDVADTVLGGSPTPASINYSVWQKSAIVGRGFEANETITQAL